MNVPAEDRDDVNKSQASEDFATAREFALDARSELARHVEAGTYPDNTADTTRLLLAALEMEYPSNAIVEWMSRTSMELTRHVQHRRAE